MAIETQLYADDFGFPMCASHLQDLLIDNGGYGLLNETCFGLQQKPHPPNFQQKQSQVQQMLRFQNMFKSLEASALRGSSSSNNMNNSTNNVNVDNSLQQSILFSQNMVDQVSKHFQEIDVYFVSQNERLRMVLQEQIKRQLSCLLKKLETKSQFMLRQKDEQIAQVSRKRMELEIFLTKLVSENQAWQRLAQEKEAMVASLKNIVEQMNERALYELMNMAEDAESCYEVESPEREAGEAEESRDFGGVGMQSFEQGTRETTKMACKICNSRRSCIVFLPCRHLCSCKACEPLLEACPVCRMPKKASIEALMD